MKHFMECTKIILRFAFLAPIATATHATSPLEHVQKVVAGYGFACALVEVQQSANDRDVVGQVACWGRGNEGQLGQSHFLLNSNYALTVPGLTDIVDVTAGVAHVCALEGDGTVKCWGRNSSGQLGDADDTLAIKDSPTPVFDLVNVRSVVAGGNHTCAIVGSSGEVMCWGGNGFGQLGVGSTTVDHYATPMYVSMGRLNLRGVNELAAGYQHTCARMSDGSVNCWGDNYYGQIGNGTNGAGISVPMRANFFGEVDSTAATVIAAGDFHTCAMTTGNGEVCWGNASDGQLGDRHTHTIMASPSAVMGMSSDIGAIAGGFLSTCSASTSGNLYCWGNNSSAQLGDYTYTNSSVPVAVSFRDRSGATSIASSRGGYADAASVAFSCAVVSRHVECWGNNDFGQLGDTTYTSTTSPGSEVMTGD